MAENLSLALQDEFTKVATALPSDLNQQRFIQNAIAVLNNNSNLTKFAKENGTSQIKAGIMKGAFLGTDFMNNEAYLIPYGKELQFMPSFKGQAKIVRKYSIRPVKEIYSKVVREGDDFEEKIIDGNPSIDYKAKPFNNGNIIGAFAVCLFTDGGMQYEVMSLEELENTRSCSKAKNSPAWSKFPEEMYKKTVLKRLCKHIEIDFDNANQIQIYNEDMEMADVKEQVANNIEENANQVDFTDVIDVEATESE